MMFDTAALRKRLEQWKSFNDWEREHGDVPASSEELLRWYSEAWELSRRHSPGWLGTGIDMEKVARIRRMRQAFARLRG